MTDSINSEENSLTIEGKCKQACVIKDKYGTDLGVAGNIITGIILLAIGVYIGFFGYRGRLVGIFWCTLQDLSFLRILF